MRTNVTVTNAFPYVMYRATGPSVPTVKEVLDESNLDRLLDDIGHTEKYIICAGRHAEEAVKRLKEQGKLKRSVKILTVEHFGLVGLNSIRKDVNGNTILVYKKAADKPSEETRSLKEISRANRHLRIEVVAKALYEQMRMLDSEDRERAIDC